MNGLIGDRFLKRFLKGFHRPTKPGVVPETLERGVIAIADGYQGFFKESGTRKARHA